MNSRRLLKEPGGTKQASDLRARLVRDEEVLDSNRVMSLTELTQDPFICREVVYNACRTASTKLS